MFAIQKLIKTNIFYIKYKKRSTLYYNQIIKYLHKKNGTPQMRDAVLILNHSFTYKLYHSPDRSATIAWLIKEGK